MRLFLVGLGLGLRLLLTLLLLLSLWLLLGLPRLLLSLRLLVRGLVKQAGPIVAVCLLGKPQIGYRKSCIFRAKVDVGSAFAFSPSWAALTRY